MATWDEVRAHLGSRWQVGQDLPSELVVSCKVPVGTQELQQALRLEPTQLDGVPWLSIVGELFHESALSSRGALLYADRLRFGAIVVRADRYLLKAGVALPGLTLAALDWHLAIVVREALRLRANLLGPPSDTVARAFDNYGE